MNEMIDSFDEKAEQLNKRKNLIIVIASILLFFCVCVIPIATFPAIINTERSGDTGKLWQNLVAYPVIISVLTFLLLLALFVCFRVKTVSPEFRQSQVFCLCWHHKFSQLLMLSDGNPVWMVLGIMVRHKLHFTYCWHILRGTYYVCSDKPY